MSMETILHQLDVPLEFTRYENELSEKALTALRSWQCRVARLLPQLKEFHPTTLAETAKIVASVVPHAFHENWSAPATRIVAHGP